jgi:membrane fusion protein (multidrug efflux system)
LNPLYVDVPQSTTELLRLQRRLESGALDQSGRGRKTVRLILEDGTEYPPEGMLQFRDVTVDPTTGTVTLRVVFPNPEGVLLPGMFVRAVVEEGVNPKALLVPQQAVSRDHKGNPFVFIVDPDGTAQTRPVVIDRAIGNRWLVTAGLSPGDRVIVEGMQKIQPGLPVKTVASAEAGATPPETGGATPSN